MRRRDFITCLGLAFVWPSRARAQQPDRVRRIGVLLPYAEDDAEAKSHLSALAQELKRLGWSQDRNIRIDVRYAAGVTDQYRALAKELAALQPDVFLSESTPAAAALKQETGTIPIVFVGVSDPVGSGFVTSLARPGGDGSRCLRRSHRTSPASRSSPIQNSKGMTISGDLPRRRHRRSRLNSSQVRSATMPPILSARSNCSRGYPGGALLFVPDATIIAHRDLVITLAARYRLPAVYPWRYFVTAGALMSYGIDNVDVLQKAASYVDRILHGAKPIDLPVQAPTKFETAVNLKTAKALGLTIPPTLLATADEVIE
jgi:putative tryptophan/tyrosine transport system substrate-binding protein